MILVEFYNNIAAQHKRLEPKINSIANHLIVIYAFALPALIQVRRASYFIIVLLFVFRGHYYKHIKNVINDRLLIALVIYFFIHIIWLIGNDDSSFTKQIVHDAAFMLTPVLFFTFIDKIYLKRIICAFIIGMIFSELISYALTFRLFNPALIDGINGEYNDPAPVYGHTHYGFMLIIFIATLFITLKNESLNKYIQILLSFFLLTSIINLFLAGGRTGPILLILLTFSYLVLYYNRKLFVSFTIALTLLAAIFSTSYYFSTVFHKRVNKTVDSIILLESEGDYATSLGYRIAILKNSGEILNDNWLFGIGTGDHIPEMQVIVHKNNPTVQKKRTIQNMANEYLGALIQFGIIGMIAFINILYQLFKYKSDYYLTNELFPLLAIALFFFTFIDIFTIGLGALLVTMFYISIGLNNYITKNTYFVPFNRSQFVIYFCCIVFFQALSYV